MQAGAAISAFIAIAVAILAIVMLRNVGSGEEREAATDAEAERQRDLKQTREHERAHRELRRHVAPAPDC